MCVAAEGEGERRGKGRGEKRQMIQVPGALVRARTALLLRASRDIWVLFSVAINSTACTLRGSTPLVMLPWYSYLFLLDGITGRLMTSGLGKDRVHPLLTCPLRESGDTEVPP